MEIKQMKPNAWANLLDPPQSPSAGDKMTDSSFQMIFPISTKWIMILNNCNSIHILHGGVACTWHLPPMWIWASLP